MIETLPKLKARILAAVVLSLAAACNVSAGGQIPCVDDSSCPATYPVCKAGFCAEGAAGTNGNASVAVLGVPGKNATDPLRGTVTVQVVAKASSGVKSISLATGTNTYAPATDSAPPIYKFSVDTTKLADGPAPFTATVTPGDSTQQAKTSAVLSFTIDNTPPTLTIGASSAVEAADGTLVAIDVTSNKQLASITGSVSGSTTALAQLAAPTGFVYHFGYAVTAGDAAGAHSVSVSGVDLAGNSSSASNAAAFNVRHPFAFGLLTLNTGHTVNEASSALPAATAGTTVSVSVSLPVSATLGTAKPVFKLTSAGGPERTLTAPTLTTGTMANTWSTTYLVVAGDNDGVAGVVASVSDLAGNTPTPAIASLAIDKSPPLSTGALASGANFDLFHNTVVITTIASKRLQSATVVVSNSDPGTCTCDGGVCNASTSLTPLVRCTVVVTHAAAATPVATLTLKDTLGNSSTGGTSYQAGYTVVPAPVNNGMSGTAIIGQGTSTLISANFSNGVGVVTGTDGSSYAPFSGVGFSVSPNLMSTYSLVVTNPAGTVAPSTTTAVVSVLAPANISSFFGPQFYVAGQAVGTLRGVFGPTGATATVTGADANSTYTCSPVNAATSPQNFTCPAPTNGLDVTYTLTVTNGPVTASATATVKVAPDPSASTALFVNGTNPVNPGGTTTFTGTVCTGCSYTISPASLIASSSLLNNTLSATTTAVSATTTFTLTVTDQAGVSASAPATVNVNRPAVSSFTGPVYSTAGAAGISLNAIFGGGTGASAAVAATAGSTGSTCTPASSTTSPQAFTCSAISADTTYTLTVTLGSGANSTASTTLVVKVALNPSSTIAFSVNGTNPINPGGTTTLTGTVCTNCTFTISPAAGIATSGVSTGTLSATTAALQVTTVFTLTVTNLAGVSATLAATVNVNKPIITSFTGQAYSTTGAGGIALNATFGGGTGASAVVVATLGTTTSTCAPPSSTTSPQAFSCSAISADTTYTLTVTLGTGANSTASTTLVVKAAPDPGASITLSVNGTNPVNPGQTTTLTGAVCTNCTFTISPAVGTSGVVTNTLSATTLALQASTVFTLTVTNLAGTSATATAPVTVRAPAITQFAGPDKSTTAKGGIQLVAQFGPAAGTGTTAASAAVVATSGSTGSNCTPSSSTTSPQTFTCTAITQDTTYTMTITLGSGTGSTASSTATVKVAPTQSATAGTMAPRFGAAIALLPNGKVLIAGGSAAADGSTAVDTALIFDPSAGTFVNAGAGAGCTGANVKMSNKRYFGSATLLPSGKVLLAGGSTDGTAANAKLTADLYDINAPDCFTALGPSTRLNTARFQHTATALPNGKVLFAGGTGTGGTALGSGELFDPTAPANQFSNIAGAMNSTRTEATATLLNNGLVLIAGGATGAAVQGDLFDYTSPAAFSPTTGSMQITRFQHSATLLGSGTVLLVGGAGANPAVTAINSAESYNPSTGNFTLLGNTLTNGRYQQTATLLPSGSVLIAGGNVSPASATPSTELFDPGTSSFSAAASLSIARTQAVTSFLFNGTALVAGGTASTVAGDLFTP